MSILLASCYLLLPRQTRRLFRQQRTLDHDFECAWDDKGFHQRWPGGTVTTTWPEYHLWFESKAVIAFGLNEQLYHFIPKRVLDEAALSDIRHYARAIEASRATL